MSSNKKLDILFWVALLWVFSPSAAHAYLDPGTGSFVVQVAVGTILGAGFFLKTCWSTIKVKASQIFAPQKKD